MVAKQHTALTRTNNVSGGTTGNDVCKWLQRRQRAEDDLTRVVSFQQEQAVSSYRRTRDGPSGRKNGCKLACATAVP